MKPKVFIGSSVEGLSVAYAIQQNLAHDAEPTVWDQGIFELSRTTIESLIEAVARSDIGVFVFSPDDVTILRGKKSSTVRDNVTFELGLFIGRLGRERVFFVMPAGEDLRLPTDLWGVTPGKYDPNRQDGSLLAATGPVCNQIRQAMKKLAPLISPERETEPDESETVTKENRFEWIEDLLNRDFSSAKRKLQQESEGKSGEELERSKAWMAYVALLEDETTGLPRLQEIAKANEASLRIQSLVAEMFLWERYNDVARHIVLAAIEKFPDDPSLLVLHSKCLTPDGKDDEAIEILSSSKLQDHPTIQIELAQI